MQPSVLAHDVNCINVCIIFLYADMYIYRIHVFNLQDCIIYRCFSWYVEGSIIGIYSYLFNICTYIHMSFNDWLSRSESREQPGDLGCVAVVNQLRLKNSVTGYLKGYHVPFPWDLNCKCKVELQPMEHSDGLTIWLWNLAILNTFWWQ